MPESRFIDDAPPGLANWSACFDAGELPVLASTSSLIEVLRANEDAVDAHLLAEGLAEDPLMTLKIHARLAEIRRGKDGTDAETLVSALVMMGITPFFKLFGPQPSVEAALQNHPEALAGFSAVLARTHRAARFALAFAVHRGDHDAAVIHDAALLHDFAELLMWVRAPALALLAARAQRADPNLRSAVVQRQVFNVELPDLQHALMLKWKLPRLLVDIADDKRSRSAVQGRCVYLAIRLARHTSSSWTNPALADDIQDIAELLNMAREPTLALLHDIDQP